MSEMPNLFLEYLYFGIMKNKFEIAIIDKLRLDLENSDGAIGNRVQA